PLRGNDRDALPSPFYRYGPPDAQIAAPLAILLDPRAADQFHERLAASVENRDFQVVDLNERIVHAHAVEHAQQMLCGGDQHALPHQAGRVADLLHVAPACGNAEPVEVGSDEHDPRGRRSRKNTNFDRNARMKPNPGRFYWTLNGGLKAQETPLFEPS